MFQGFVGILLETEVQTKKQAPGKREVFRLLYKPISNKGFHVRRYGNRSCCLGHSTTFV